MQKATLKVLNIDKVDVQADNTTVQDVRIAFFRNDEQVEEKRLSFPLDTTPDQLKEELAKVLATYNLEAEQAEVNAAHEAAHKTADETIQTMTGFELAPQEGDTAPQVEENAQTTEQPADDSTAEVTAEPTPDAGTNEEVSQ